MRSLSRVVTSLMLCGAALGCEGARGWTWRSSYRQSRCSSSHVCPPVSQGYAPPQAPEYNPAPAIAPQDDDGWIDESQPEPVDQQPLIPEPMDPPLPTDAAEPAPMTDAPQAESAAPMDPPQGESTPPMPEEELPPLPPETDTPVPNATLDGASTAIPNLLKPFKVRPIFEHPQPSKPQSAPAHRTAPPTLPRELPTDVPVAAVPRGALQRVAGPPVDSPVTLLPPEALEADVAADAAPLTLRLPALPGHSTQP